MRKSKIERVCELSRKIGISTMGELQRFKEENKIERCTLDQLIAALEYELEQGGETPCQE